MPTVELLMIGDELLLGRTADANGPWLAKQVYELGWNLSRVQLLPDQETSVIGAINSALQRADVVVTTGGLGPTRDDMTRPALQKIFGGNLVAHAPSKTKLEAWFAARNRPWNPHAEGMVQYLDSAQPLDNPAGAAPGMHFTTEFGRHLFALPGVPREMQAMASHHLLPWLQQQGTNRLLRQHTWRLVGIPESSLAARLEPVEGTLPEGFSLAYNPHDSLLDLRLQLNGQLDQAGELLPQFENLQSRLAGMVHDLCYAEGETRLEAVIGALLHQKGLSLACAESLSGGQLCARLVQVPGASAWLQGGVVAYANLAKQQVLGVPETVLHQHGAVSAACAQAMAQGASQHLHSTVGLSLTGLAGPEGDGTPTPVGTVFVGLHAPGITTTQEVKLVGDRQRIIDGSVVAALQLLWRWLSHRLPAA